MKKSTIYSALSAISACVFLFSTTMAYAEWRIQNDTINVITMASVRGNIIEEYEQNSVVYPDSAVTKIVQVKNTGTIPALPRVKIEKVWGDGRNEDGTLQINSELSTDNILIEYDTEDWIYREADGYFYYNHVLEPGEVSASLFDSFMIDEATTGSEYRNKSADIIVNLEIIQAGEGVLSYWGTSYDELGIIYRQEEQIELVTKVNFNSPTKGFSFDVNMGDLFAGFKNLIPGEARSQIIEITNNWEDSISINFWAEYVDQENMDERAKELVYQMLHEYAVIMISDPEGQVLYHGPIWGNPDIDSDKNDSMRNPLPLGRFKPKEVKRLNVSLTLDSHMNSEDLELIGRVKWVFSAQGASSTSETLESTDIPGVTDVVEETTTTANPFGSGSSITDIGEGETTTTTNPHGGSAFGESGESEETTTTTLVADDLVTNVSTTDDRSMTDTTMVVESTDGGNMTGTTTVIESTEVKDKTDTETTTTIYHVLPPPDTTEPQESTEQSEQTTKHTEQTDDQSTDDLSKESSTEASETTDQSEGSTANTEMTDHSSGSTGDSTSGSSGETASTTRTTTTTTNSGGGSGGNSSSNGGSGGNSASRWSSGSSGGNRASNSTSDGSSTLNNTEYTSTPKTGDTYPIRFYSGLAAVSFLTMLLLDSKTKKKKS